MGQKSVKEEKNVWHMAREGAGLSRQAASERMDGISADRIYRWEMEGGPDGYEAVQMARAYQDPWLVKEYLRENPVSDYVSVKGKRKSVAEASLYLAAMLEQAGRLQKDIFMEVTAARHQKPETPFSGLVDGLLEALLDYKLAKLAKWNGPLPEMCEERKNDLCHDEQRGDRS